MIYLFLVAMLGIALSATPGYAQILPVFGADDSSDVIDHTRFDSLWHASVQAGKLYTDGVESECYTTYRQALATARPQEYCLNARLAFWANAGYACLMDVMRRRTGYRHVVWDSMFLQRDTFVVAGVDITLQGLHDTLLGTARDTRPMVFCATGSTQAPPLPAHVPMCRTLRVMMRDLLRRICRSENYVLWDPAANIVQMSSCFRPYQTRMRQEAGNEVQWILPYVTEAMAASLALRKAELRVVIADRIERFRKGRAERRGP